MFYEAVYLETCFSNVFQRLGRNVKRLVVTNAVMGCLQPRDSTFTRVGSVMESPMTNKEWIPRNFYQPASKSFFPPESIEHGYNAGLNGYGMGGPMEPSRTTTSSRDDVSVSNASELETEWVEQDEPGVYITIRQLADGTRELRRVRFR